MRIVALGICIFSEGIYAEVIEQIDQVTLDNAHAQAAEYFNPERRTLTLLGDPPAMSDYQALIAP